MNQTGFAIRLMAVQAVLFAAETAAIHQFGPRLSVMQLALVRSIGGIALAVALARYNRVAFLRARRPALQLVRGAVSLLYLWVMIYSFANMPFADATAISYTQAAYIALFSVLILGEPVGPAHWAAAALGIAGALLIAKPAFAGWNAVYLVAVVGTSLNGLSFVLNRYLQREDSEPTTLFYSNLVPLVGNLPALALASVPSGDALACLPALLFFGPIGMLAGLVAVRHASASALGPYTLLRLVIGVFGGVIVFHELPDALSVLGATAVLGSCILSSSRLLDLVRRCGT